MARDRKLWSPTGVDGTVDDARSLRDLAYDAAHSVASSVVSLFNGESYVEHERVRAVAEAAGIEPFTHPLLDLQQVLAAGRRRKLAEREVVWLGHILATNRAGDRQRGRAARLRERLAALKQQIGGQTDEPAPVSPEGGLPAEVIRALELVRGDAEPLPKPAPAEKQLAELDEQLADIGDGERAVADMIEAAGAARSVASLEAAKRLQKTHEGACLRVYRMAQSFISACEDERLIRAAHADAGYLPRSDILPPPLVRGVALQLGSESAWESLISQYRRELQSRGLLE